jgi:hypothetical protein
MLKFFFACLLIANGALFAYQRGYLDTFLSDGHEPSRAARQLNADKIKLISAAEAAAAAAAASAAASASATSNAPASAIDPAADAAAKPDVTACSEIGNFAEADAAKFEKLLAKLTLGDRLSRRKFDEVSSHIVSIPPQGSKEGAEKKAAELRHLGINDFFIIKDEGSMQWGISLGVYKTQERAQSRLAELYKSGVHSAKIAPFSTVNKIAFQIHNLDPGTKEALDKIKAGFPQQEMRSCM